MIAAPAVDLRGGRCVQLVGGVPGSEKISLPDPASVARGWWELGFRTLHLVDLDAALGSGDQQELLVEAAEGWTGTVQAGGGVRDSGKALALLNSGVDRIIVGTRAIDDPRWLAGLSQSAPGQVMVATDVRDGMVLRRGWTESSGRTVESLIEDLNPLPLAGILCTDVAKEGLMEGIDLSQAERLIQQSHHPVWISGGIHTLEELRALDAIGATGAVLGMALYTGTLDGKAVAEEFGDP